MTNTIPIVLISDEKFVLPASVMLKSLYENKKPQTHYKIFILTDDMTKLSSKLLCNLSKENFEVQVLFVKNQLININSSNKVVSNTAYLKFAIAENFPNIDKILYLDVDTIILDDLTKLYNIDLKDTYAGVVLDYCVMNYENRAKLLGLKQYFNSGIMLLNCEKIREEKLADKLCEWIKNNCHKYRFKDQDAFNVCFNNNITIIEPKYNFFSSLAFYNKREYLKFYNITKKRIDVSDIIIIHYTWKKPWIYKDLPYSEYWYKYYDLLYDKKLELKTCFFTILYVNLRNRLNFLKIIDKSLKRRNTKTI